MDKNYNRSQFSVLSSQFSVLSSQFLVLSSVEKRDRSGEASAARASDNVEVSRRTNNCSRVSCRGSGAAEIEAEKGFKGCSLTEIGSLKLIVANFGGSLFHNNCRRRKNS